MDGPSGAGKSTFAEALAEHTNAQLIRTDHFATWDDPTTKWWPRLIEVLDRIARNTPAAYRKTDWSHGFPRPEQGEWVHVAPKPVIILEGFSAARKANHRASLTIFVDHGDEAARLERAVRRDGEQNRANFQRWQAFERGWFAVDETKARADYVVVTAS
ncbi:uridine kinase family protein [Lentzea guizhouensis]|uniref:uridine kinase family protein n=1 Tax=Lentzea guizhouensis TaxID=1586287 RepID=UPI001F008AB3|nr:AAA family ATPase [Lentzea guizhouensis]